LYRRLPADMIPLRDMKESTILLGLKTTDGNEVRFGTPAQAVPCFRCGLCCTDYLVKLSSRDIAVLVRGLGIPRAEVLRKYVKKTPVGPVMRQNGRECVFLGRDERGASSCSVYEFRPEVCRNYAPSLLRPECQEGLRRKGKAGEILLIGEIYGAGGEAEWLAKAIANNQDTMTKQ
jgi:Fe-S-cluster containining protein